jgi:hypothetical protein
MMTTTEPNPTAADSGRSATASFARKQRGSARADTAR